MQTFNNVRSSDVAPWCDFLKSRAAPVHRVDRVVRCRLLRGLLNLFIVGTLVMVGSLLYVLVCCGVRMHVRVLPTFHRASDSYAVQRLSHLFGV